MALTWPLFSLALTAIRELVYKRGFGKVNKQRLPLSDNQIVEANLGKFGIVSVEDIIHELHTAGPNFKQVASFLWPFKLSSPTGGFKSVLACLILYHARYRGLFD